MIKEVCTAQLVRSRILCPEDWSWHGSRSLTEILYSIVKACIAREAQLARIDGCSEMMRGHFVVVKLK